MKNFLKELGKILVTNFTIGTGVAIVVKGIKQLKN